MPVQTTTHLNFRGDALQALEFYQSVFGGHLVVNTYADFGIRREPGSEKVVFGLVRRRERVPPHGVRHPRPDRGWHRRAAPPPREQHNDHRPGAVRLDQFAHARRAAGLLGCLAVDATIVEPLAASAWSAGFGMLTDPFGRDMECLGHRVVNDSTQFSCSGGARPALSGFRLTSVTVCLWPRSAPDRVGIPHLARPQHPGECGRKTRRNRRHLRGPHRRLAPLGLRTASNRCRSRDGTSAASSRKHAPPPRRSRPQRMRRTQTFATARA